MLNFISENMATILGSAIVASVFILIVTKQIKDKKSGKSGCGCGCGNCPNNGVCH